MIDLTIKTLDSQNRSFNVPEDFTVRQLKEHIAESVNIAPDVQRLIHCGRVLVDENKLSTYNVHGKVIHLVERAPPSASTGRGDPDGATSGDAGGWRILGGGGRGRRRGDSNTMYLGAMAFPAEMMDARGMSIPQSRPCLTRSRLMVARSMLNTATRTLGRLENPRPPAETTASQEGAQEQSQETQGEESRQDSSSGDSQSEDNDEANVDLATQAATAAALVSAVSAVMQDAAGSSTQPDQDSVDITIEEVDPQATPMIDDTEDAASPISPIVLSPASPTAAEHEAPPAPSSAADSADPASQTAESSEDPTASETAEPAPQARNNQPARPQCMAAVIAQLDELNRRLHPYMTQYYNLLHHDPNYEDPEIAQVASEYNFPSSAADADALFRSVSEIMHSLSHSYHALSDIVCSYTRQPAAEGRVLRCRPVLIQHSAVLHAPVPVIVDRGSRITAPGAPTATPAATATSTNASTANAVPSPASAPQPAAGARPSFTPNNLDIFMELGPTITIDSVEATFLPRGAGAGQANVAGQPQAGVSTGAFPWGTPPPPEFIQNLVQAVSERMGEAGEANIHIAFPEIAINTGRPVAPARNPAENAAPNASGNPATSAAAPASTTSPSGGVRPAADAQNSQARGNTETHPTTATQTRSTSRPQILLARNLSNVARNLQGHLRTFDPFLPCNSHHIRNRRSGAPRSTQSQEWPAGNNNNNAAQPGGARPAGAGAATDVSEQLAAAGNIVDYLISHSHEGTMSGLSAGPNILALGPFGSGAATANISFEIGRVPLNMNMGGTRPQAAAASPLSPPMSEQGNSQVPFEMNFNLTVDVDLRVEDSNTTENSVNSASATENSANDSVATGGFLSGLLGHIGRLLYHGPPPVSRVETDPANATGANNASGGAGGFLSSLLGQLGNLLPQGSGVEILNGMRNAGGTSAGAENNTGASPWVEISASGGAMGGARGPPPDFMSFMQTFHPQVQIRQSRPARPNTPLQFNNAVPARYPLYATLVANLASHESLRAQINYPTTLEQLLGLRTNLPESSRSYLHELIHTVLISIRYRYSASSQGLTRLSYVPELEAVQYFMRRYHERVTEEVVETHARLIQDVIEQYLNSVPQLDIESRVVDGIDLRASLARLHREWLRKILDAMAAFMNPPMLVRSVQTRLDEVLRQYVQHLLLVLQLAFGSNSVSDVLATVINRAVVGVSQSVPEGTGTSNDTAPFAVISPAHAHQLPILVNSLPALIRELTAGLPMASGVRYLVHTADMSRPPRVGVTPQVTSNPAPRGGEPMDLEAADVSQVASAPVNTRPDDPLPDNIIIGSESWHNTIPSDWVPIITRDTQRQRRESNQGPFSDAYLSGMPTKRRKIVTSSKPSTNLTRAISDTMSTALSQASVASSSQSEAIATAAAQDPALRVAYRDQIQAQLGESLASNSDFTADRYPNAAKFFDAKKKQ